MMVSSSARNRKEGDQVGLEAGNSSEMVVMDSANNTLNITTATVFPTWYGGQ
jgi:hypothetical protein